MSNGLNKEEQISCGLLTRRKGDWCEMIVQAYYRKLGWLVYPKFSGPIDIILINEETGKVRFIDVKYKNTRKGTKTNGRRINRTIKTPLKKFLKIELIYVDDDGNIEFAYTNGRERWAKEFEVGRNKNGQYNGKVLKKK